MRTLTEEKLSVDIISTNFFLNLSCLEDGRNNFTSIEPQSNHKMFVPKLGANTELTFKFCKMPDGSSLS